MMSLGQFRIRSLPAESPDGLPGPVFRHGAEMVKHNTQAQITVNFPVISVGTAHQADASVVEQKSVGLPV